MRKAASILCLIWILVNPDVLMGQGNSADLEGYRNAPLPSFAQPTLSYLDIPLILEEGAKTDLFYLKTYHCPTGKILNQVAFYFGQTSDQFASYCHSFPLALELELHECLLVRNGKTIDFRDNPHSSLSVSVTEFSGDTLSAMAKVCWRLPELVQHDIVVISFSSHNAFLASDQPWSLAHMPPNRGFEHHETRVVTRPGMELNSLPPLGRKLARTRSANGQITYSTHRPGNLDPDLYNAVRRYDLHPDFHYSNLSEWSEVRADFRDKHELGQPLPSQVAAWADSLCQGLETPYARSKLIWEHIRDHFVTVPPTQFNYRDRATTFAYQGGSRFSVGCLLGDLIHHTGLNAIPFLVKKDGLLRGIEGFPGKHYFDHIVFKVDLNGQSQWIDLEADQFLSPYLENYRVGLPLAEEENGLSLGYGEERLTPIPNVPMRRLEIRDEVLSMNKELHPRIFRKLRLTGEWDTDDIERFATLMEDYCPMDIKMESSPFLYRVFRAFEKVENIDWSERGTIYGGSTFEDFNYNDTMASCTNTVRKPIWDFYAPDSISYTDQGMRILTVTHSH